MNTDDEYPADANRDDISDKANDKGSETTTGRMIANMNENLNGDKAGRAVGEGVGGIGGFAAGAAIGSLAGPIGTVIGAVAGAVGGWWAGREVAESAAGYSGDADTHHRSRFELGQDTTRGDFASYDHARPLYQLGYVAAQNPDYHGRSFNDVEPDLKRGWSPDMENQYGSWDNARGAVNSAYDSAREAEVERQEMNADAVGTADLEMGDRIVRIPLTSEEPAVQNRAVAMEEVNRTREQRRDR